ncbi:MAG: homocysteine S-methyltransferase family protein, partial [Tissierella sp.]|uniref:homocysteine S-methyltransferase family protein n=1 Tax=Tissierella sp. TaxID=41274 RepID=UPI003F94E2BB
MGIKEKLQEDILAFDGAMGTMIQNLGIKVGELPEALNINSPEKIIGIHKKYIEAGSNIITTNTFGVNEKKLKDSAYTVEELIHGAVKNARKAIDGRDIYVALDIGPIGELLEPMGSLSFEDAYDIYKRQVVQGVKDGVDLILIETMTDLYEVKAAVLAAKENSNLPIFATMSYEKDGRTFTGCNIRSMVMVLEGLGVDALGVNCSLGPKEIEPLVDELLLISNTPIMVQANAGLPSVVDGETVFNISPDEFARYGASFIKKGVKIIGGCCGTTDKDINVLTNSIKDIRLNKNIIENINGVCTPTKVVNLDKVRVIGERINPTGKELFKQALVKGKIDYILKEAIAQADAGAHILDINVGLPEIDEKETMVKVIKEIQSILDIPLQIDSTDPHVIEAALRVYNGKAIVNSVNGEDKVLDSILPIVKKYGALVIGLTLDENGIPKGANERFKIAKKIVAKAKEYGIGKEDIIIDSLTLTAAAQQEDVKETLNTLRLVKEKLGVKTALGVSNVSFGLANRELINKTFLGAALFAGLDLPIIDPLNQDMMDTIKASKVLWNEDIGASDYLKSYENIKEDKNSKKENMDIDKDLFQIILTGMKEETK